MARIEPYARQPALAQSRQPDGHAWGKQIEIEMIIFLASLKLCFAAARGDEFVTDGVAAEDPRLVGKTGKYCSRRTIVGIVKDRGLWPNIRLRRRVCG